MRNYFDKSIYITFGSVILLSLIVLVKEAVFSTPPITLNYTIPDEVYAGDLVSFNDHTEGAGVWFWDFGDKKGQSTRQNPTYTYSEDGTYYVKLIVNKSVSGEKKIRVQRKVVTAERIAPVVEWPKLPRAGEKLTFKDLTPGATNWSWDFDSEENSNTKEASYTFLDPGTKRIELRISGRGFTGSLVNYLEVLSPVVKKVIVRPISDTDWKNQFVATIAEKGKSLRLVKYAELTTYLSDPYIPVLINSDKKESFYDFYKNAENSQYVIYKTTLHWDSNNRIKKIDVALKK